MLLHTLSCSPDHPAFRQCLASLGKEDALVLMGDGVYVAAPHSHALASLVETGAAIFILRDDAEAAGLTTLPNGSSFASMADFVELTERHPRQMAWY
jgi:tRNA 2-thiouridine synthesizing protein B